MCDPSAVALRVVGLEQGAKVPPASSLHWKPPGMGSSAVKAKVGVESFEKFDGVWVSVIVGGSVSIVQV